MIEAPYEPFGAASDGRIRPLAMPNRQAHPPVCVVEAFSAIRRGRGFASPHAVERCPRRDP